MKALNETRATTARPQPHRQTSLLLFPLSAMCGAVMRQRAVSGCLRCRVLPGHDADVDIKVDATMTPNYLYLMTTPMYAVNVNG